MTRLEPDSETSRQRLADLRHRMQMWGRDGVRWTRDGKRAANERGEPVGTADGIATCDELATDTESDGHYQQRNLSPL